ncbi:hypothetical protein Tco_1336881 [Tanacetum coccineum]
MVVRATALGKDFSIVLWVGQLANTLYGFQLTKSVKTIVIRASIFIFPQLYCHLIRISWDNVQAMIDANYQMAQQMQAEEQEKLSIEEKSKMFVQLLEVRKKHFVAMRAQEEKNKPPTKAQKRNTMSTYLKNMAGYKHNQLKNKRFDDIKKLFDKAIKRVNTFVDMDTELVEGGEEMEQESSKKQKLEEDKETAELERLIEVVPDKEEVAIDP